MELFCSIIDLVNYLPSLKQEVETIFSNAYFYYIIARKDPDMKKRALAVLLAFSMVFCNTGYLYAAEEGDAAGESTGETLPAFHEPEQNQYQHCQLTAERAAAIPCRKVLGSYIVRFSRYID